MRLRIRPTLAWLLPLLVLAGALVVDMTGAGGVTEKIRDSAAANPFLSPGLTLTTMGRPLFVDQAELLFLTGAGLVIVLLFVRAKPFWAGTIFICAVGVASLFSWWLASEAGLQFDAAFPSLALAAVFAAGLGTHLSLAAFARARIRGSLAQHFAPSVMAAVARKPELLELRGKSRELTYLVCGIRGFPEIVDSFGSNAVGLAALVRRVMSPLVACVIDRQGAVDRIMPEGLTAFFNAPLEDREHASHACECAWRMISALETVNRALDQERHADGSPLGPIEIGIGIHSGIGVVGDFGIDARPEYTVAGRAVRFAASLEWHSAKFGPAILVGEGTRTAAERNFAFLEVDLLEAGGGGRPSPVYALLGNAVLRSSPRFRALQTFHLKVLQAYRAQEWEKARALIEKCRALSGASPRLCDLYVERIAYFQKNPPGEGWDGVLRPIQT